MNATRAAGDGWRSECTSLLELSGFVNGEASACVFRHRERNLVSSLHGDDFTSSGPKAHFVWMKSQVEAKYELKEVA